MLSLSDALKMFMWLRSVLNSKHHRMSNYSSRAMAKHSKVARWRDIIKSDQTICLDMERERMEGKEHLSQLLLIRGMDIKVADRVRQARSSYGQKCDECRRITHKRSKERSLIV